MTFAHPYADFPYVLNNGYSAIYNVKTRQTLKANYGVKGTDGTGPFTLKEFVPGSHVTVKRWEKYPGTILPFLTNKRKPYLDAIRWEVLLEPATRAKEIEAGNIDTLRGPAPQDVDRLKHNDKLAVIEFQEPAMYQLGVNFRRKDLGFDDVRVRQGRIVHRFIALASSAWSTAGVAGLEGGDQALEPPLLFRLVAPGYEIGAGPLWRLPEAQRPGAGGIRQKNGKRLSFKVIIEQDATEALVAQAVQQMLKAIGIDMSFVQHGADYYEVVLKGAVAYMVKQLWTNVFDASLLWASSQYFAPACCNVTYIKIPELDKAFYDWQHARSESQLRAASQRAQMISAKQLPFIPIVTPHVVWVHSKKVHGWLPTQSNLYPFYNDVWISA